MVGWEWRLRERAGVVAESERGRGFQVSVCQTTAIPNVRVENPEAEAHTGSAGFDERIDRVNHIWGLASGSLSLL
jgi:hypothetical protein